MSFGGAVGAMISSLKNNKRERKSAFDKLKNHKAQNRKLHFDNKASKEDLKKIRQKLLLENRKTNIKNILVFIFILSLFIYFFAFFKY